LGRADREKQIQELHGLFSGLDMAILADYRGLTVEDLTVFRSRLRDVGAGFRVVKNTLSIRAAEGTPLEVLKERFKGPVAIMHTVSDPVGPAKVFVEFMKTNEHLKPSAGVLAGKLIGFEDVKLLAGLPDRETLLAKAFSSMNAPATNFVRTLSEVPAGFVRLIGAIARSKEAA
jgi:large subunit ribosomal protein L10